MKRRDISLAIVERSLMSVGVTLVLLFVAASLYREVYSRLALRNFDKSQSSLIGIDRESQPAAVEHQQVDFRLWSEKRAQTYRDSLLIPNETPLAVLGLTKFHLRVPVFEGTDELTLNQGAGWINGTAKPGTAGNVGIAGHRDGFFRRLKDIAVGDPIELSNCRRRAVY